MVSRFRNGDRSNDPPNTLPWTTDWPWAGIDANLDGRSYGGDLQGLQARLPYLKDLGVNGLVLSPIFHVRSEPAGNAIDCRHVDDTLGVKTATAEITGETLDPKTWKFSASDRVFLEFLKTAHEHGFRVVLELTVSQVAGDSVVLSNVEAEHRPLTVLMYLIAVAQRWLDPNGDGDPSDGIDGWVFTGIGDGIDKIDASYWSGLRDHVKAVNANALLIGDLERGATANLSDVVFDGRIGRDAADAIRRFFAQAFKKAANRPYSLKSFFGDLTTIQERHPLDHNLVTLNSLGGLGNDRLLASFFMDDKGRASPAIPTGDPPSLSGDHADRWRLATVFQHLYLGAQMTYYGDEVGMLGGTGPYSRAPMWWMDLPGQSTKPTGYRGDFFALLQLLHSRRDIHAPLRRGDCKPILLDETRQLLALSRSLPGDEAILLMNYGDVRQKVQLTVGKPGQMIGILSPQLKPSPSRRKAKPPLRRKDKPPLSSAASIPKLRMGGSRQFVDREGHISLWVKPRSVRIILVKDKIPQ